MTHHEVSSASAVEARARAEQLQREAQATMGGLKQELRSEMALAAKQAQEHAVVRRVEAEATRVLGARALAAEGAREALAGEGDALRQQLSLALAEAERRLASAGQVSELQRTTARERAEESRAHSAELQTLRLQLAEADNAAREAAAQSAADKDLIAKLCAPVPFPANPVQLQPYPVQYSIV